MENRMRTLAGVPASLGLDFNQVAAATPKRPWSTSTHDGKGPSKRHERRATGITARQQRIRNRRLHGKTDKIQVRRYERIQRRLFASGPGCQVRERRYAALLTKRDVRFLCTYADARRGE